MTLITRLDYEGFLERYLIQDADSYGRVLRAEVRRRVIEWRGSNRRTYKSHELALVRLDYLSDLGGYYQINEPYFTALKKRVQDKREERDRLALMQRNFTTGEPVPLDYSKEHKKVTDITAIIERQKREDRVKRVDRALTFIADRRAASAGDTSNAPLLIGTLTPTVPSFPSVTTVGQPPAPQKPKEAEK